MFENLKKKKEKNVLHQKTESYISRIIVHGGWDTTLRPRIVPFCNYIVMHSLYY